jgi:PmbA protein
VKDDTMLQAARAAALQARRHGADEAKVVVSRSRGVDLEWRDGRLERVQERTQRSLNVELFVNGRYSASSTNDLRPEALEHFFADAVAMTRLLEPDPHRCLPDARHYEGRADVDLDALDESYDAVSSADRRARIAELETLIRALHPDLPIISVSTEISDTRAQSARVHTNGFEGAREGTSFVLGGQVTVKDVDGRRPMGHDYSVRRHRADLEGLVTLAQTAGDRARLQLGAGKLATGRYTIVLENRAVGRLLGAFLGPLGGPALQQKQSLWDGKLGEAIASPLLTIYDDPHRPRALGSALWDGDGFATHRRPLIEAGVLKTFLIDHYYGLKLGVAPTGGETHNLDWTLGTRDLAGLVADVGEGMLIDRFLGGNSNSTTGEFSFGCAGRVIRNGQLAEPVAEVNLAGNLASIWKQLVAVGSDPNPDSSSACPSCVFEGAQLSGQ